MPNVDLHSVIMHKLEFFYFYNLELHKRKLVLTLFFRVNFIIISKYYISYHFFR